MCVCCTNGVSVLVSLLVPVSRSFRCVCVCVCVCACVQGNVIMCVLAHVRQVFVLRAETPPPVCMSVCLSPAWHTSISIICLCCNPVNFIINPVISHPSVSVSAKETDEKLAFTVFFQTPVEMQLQFNLLRPVCACVCVCV